MAIRTFGLANQNRRLYTHSPRNPAESPLPVESNCLGDGGDHPKSVVGRRSLGKSPIDFQVRRSRFPKWPDRIVCLQACMVPIYLIRISKYVVGAIFKMLCWSCRPNSTCSISLSLSLSLMLLSLHLTVFLESCCQISSKYGIHPKALLTNLVRHSANQLEVGIVFFISTSTAFGLVHLVANLQHLYFCQQSQNCYP